MNSKETIQENKLKSKEYHNDLIHEKKTVGLSATTGAFFKQTIERP